MESERSSLGASFVEVMCFDKKCAKREGFKILHLNHKGYESNGALSVTPEELAKAEKIGLEHERTTHHEVKIVEGQLEGKVY